MVSEGLAGLLGEPAPKRTDIHVWMGDIILAIVDYQDARWYDITEARWHDWQQFGSNAAAWEWVAERLDEMGYDLPADG